MREGSGEAGEHDVVLPSGTLTFLFTDIESSTRRWELRPDNMRAALAQHDAIMAESVTAQEGAIFKHTGDGVGAVFRSAPNGLRAAIEAQRALQQATWPGDDRLKVRMGLHAGDAEPSGGDYVGATVNRAARIMDVGNGDQIAVSPPVVALAPHGRYVSNGEHQLRGIGTEEVSVVVENSLILDERPLRSRVPVRGHQVPVRSADLIGRDDDVQVLADLLAQHRQVTVTGPGGVGKTRLATETARAIGDRFEHGAVYCELASVSDADALPDVVAQALGARLQPGMDLTESIISYIDGREVLLLLDNCEHLLADVGALVSRMLLADGPSVLATSRLPLGGQVVEQLFPLDPLDAVAGTDLFITRALERDPKFRVDPDTRANIASICQHLDGIPGAIELAAARVRVLAPAQLLDRLDDRFRVLRGQRRSDTGQTLYDTVRWSYDQLDPAEAHLFEMLSVFVGGFSLEAAATVYDKFTSVETDPVPVDEGVVIDILMALVDKSMVATERGFGQVRFQMLETMRAFGSDRLAERGDLDIARVCHAQYFATVASDRSALLYTSKEVEVWTELGQDWGNLRAAFETFETQGDLDQAVEMVIGLSWYATLAMRFEALSWARDLIDSGAANDDPRRPALLGAAALSAYFVADPKAADYAQEALVVDPLERSGLARGSLSAIYLNNLHALDDSETITSDWIDTLDETSTAENRMWAMGMRTFHLALNGDDGATPVARELLAIAMESGSASAIALAHWAQGLTLAAEIKLAQAEAAWNKGLDSARSLSEEHLLVHLLNGLLAHFKAPVGELRSVMEFCHDALSQAIEQHYLTGTSHLFGVTAIALSRAGDPETGAALLGAMEANGHVPRDPALPLLRSALGNGFAAASAVGDGWSVKQAADIALTALDGFLAAGDGTDETER